MIRGWKLTRDGTLLGKLTYRELDQPWFLCDFEPTTAFQTVAPLFERELQALETGFAKQGDEDKWEEIFAEISQLGLHLEPLDQGELITDFLLHIDGKEAWFRY